MNYVKPFIVGACFIALLFLSFQKPTKQAYAMEGYGYGEAPTFYVWDATINQSRGLKKFEAVQFMYAQGYTLVFATDVALHSNCLVTTLYFEK